MHINEFRKIIEVGSQQLNLKKFKSAYLIESEDSIVFLILRRSAYSNRYYLRIKCELKPLEDNFDNSKYITHDVGDVMLTLDSRRPELFDLDNSIPDDERMKSLECFLSTVVKDEINVLSSKILIVKEYDKGNMVLLPYVKSKLSLG